MAEEQKEPDAKRRGGPSVISAGLPQIAILVSSLAASLAASLATSIAAQIKRKALRPLRHNAPQAGLLGIAGFADGFFLFL